MATAHLHLARLIAGIILLALAHGGHAQAPQGCQHLGNNVQCPGGVADGSGSLQFLNGGLDILWSDTTVTAAAGCCALFVVVTPSPTSTGGGSTATNLVSQTNRTPAASAVQVYRHSGGGGGSGMYPDWAEKAGAVGLGSDTTLGGTNGQDLRYMVRTYVGTYGHYDLLGFNFADESASSEGDTTTSSADLGAYLPYKLAYWQRGHLSVLFSVDVRSLTTSVDAPLAGDSDSDSDSDSEETTTNIVIGLGLQGGYFPTQYLSLFANSGVRLEFLTTDEAGAVGIDTDSNDVSGLDLSLGADLWGSAGHTVWFN